MKFFVPLKVTLLLAVILSFNSILAQSSINGGSITTASICATRTNPASDLSNLSSPTGGTAPYTYQWEAKIEYSNWTNVINVGNGLNLSPGILLYNTTYRRKVTDAAGAVAYSNDIKFFLVDELNAGNISLDGSAFVLVNQLPSRINTSDAVSGTGNYSYSWEVSTVSANGPWSTISGESGLSYQPSPFSAPGIKYFRKKATDLNCSGVVAAYTGVVQIEALLTLPFEKGYWTYRYPCVFAGSTPSLLSGTVARGGTAPYTYQWEMRLANETVWNEISGATSVSYQPPAITASTYYRRKSSDAAGATGYSNEDVVAYVATTANGGLIAANQSSIIAPNAPLFAISNVVSASNFYNGFYYWQTSADNGATWASILNSNYSNFFPNTPPTSATCYRRAIREACASSERDTWSNIVCFNPAPLVDGNISYGSGNSGCVTASTLSGTITGTPATGGATPYTYKWQNFDGTDWIDILSSNSVSYTPGVLNHDSKFRRVVTDANGTSLTSNEVSITISSNTPLKGGLIDGPIVTCSNTAPGIINNIIDACGGGGAFTYTWEASVNGAGWSTVVGANQPTYNATSIGSTTKYRRKVGDGCGNAVYSNEVEVFVYPTIEAGSITPTSQTVCTNQLPESLGLTQNCHYTNGNVTYQWQRSASANGSWTNVYGATQPVFQPKASTTTLYYRLVVKSSVCNAEAITNVSAVILNTNCSSGRTIQGVSTNDNRLSSNLSGKGTLKLYPNPVSKGQTVFVTFDGDGANCKASLRGTDGRVYNCTVEAASKGSLQVKMPVNVAQGTYLIQLTNGQKQWVERIVIF